MVKKRRYFFGYRKLFLFSLFFIVYLLPQKTEAAFWHTPEVKLFNKGGGYHSFFAYDQEFKGGVQVVAVDLGNDGIAEIITAAGPGGGPHIRVLRADGSEISEFMAYPVSMRKGVNIAVGDLDNDGQLEIVTAPRYGAAPHIRIFDIYGQPKFTPGFFAYDQKFRGGVSLAIGDLDGDGINEIITGAGPGGGPHVRSFDRYGRELANFFPFHPAFRGGINVAVANVDGGLDDELVVGVQRMDSPRVKVIKKNGHERVLGQFLAFNESFKGGVRVAGGDIDNDGFDEIIVGAGASGGPQVRGFEGYGRPLALNFFAYDQKFRGGVNVSIGDINGDGIEEVITSPSSWQAEGRVDLPKYILVDLSEQRLSAYEYGRLVKTFLVSTGLPGWDTPTGTFSVSQKIYSHLYSGPNYYFPHTLWNLRYDGPRLLHGAYWHNDFGRRKSHGCVNIAYPNAEWLYNWADIGTTVIVQQ